MAGDEALPNGRADLLVVVGPEATLFLDQVPEMVLRVAGRVRAAVPVEHGVERHGPGPWVHLGPRASSTLSGSPVQPAAPVLRIQLVLARLVVLLDLNKVLHVLAASLV